MENITTRYLLLFCALFLFATFPAESEKPVRLNTGLVTGAATRIPGVRVYKGIPFAAPPVGPLRWQPPQPPARWEGVRKAEEFCAPCMQQVTGEFGPYTREFIIAGAPDENCLALNVWTAANAARERRPVMVWIYGGGFTTGGNDVAIYDGAALAKKGIVLVGVNYRVGPLGFLAHPELTKESPQRASGNYGLLDQVAALQWVKRNIAAFGGDPNHVTIFGQSAGAISVRMLMQSPLARGLFERAILESAPGLLPENRVSSGMKLAEAEQAGLRFAEAKKARSLAELRALPAKELTARGATAGTSWPILDGWFLPENNPHASEVPILIGMTADDIGISNNRTPSTVAAYQADARQKYGARADEYLKLYPANADAEVNAQRARAARDQARVSLHRWTVRQLALSRQAYAYVFTRAIPWPQHPEFGAFHTGEVPYVFDTLHTLDRPWEPIDRTLAERLSSYWVNFATTGSPNGKGLPDWRPVDPASRTIMELGVHTGAIPVASPDVAAFWEGK